MADSYSSETIQKPPAARTKARKVAALRAVTLRGGAAEDGFSTLDLLDGLHGVCTALYSSAQYGDQLSQTHRLAMAAKALSAMLAARVPS